MALLKEKSKRVLKGLRDFPPVSRIATSTVRMFLDGVGHKRPEFVVAHLPRIGPVKSKLPNGEYLRLHANGDDWVSNQVYWRGWSNYEKEVASFFYHLAKESEITLDIGAHIGFYSLVAAHANREGKVFAFEPVPETFARLKKNVSINRLGNVECLNVAVGETDGMGELFRPNSDALPCSAGMAFEFYKPWAEVFSSIQVELVTIDSIVTQRVDQRRVDLVKIDTESTEPSVLRGMKQTLERDRPNIICEVLCGFGVEPQLEEIFQPFGYYYYLLTSDGPERCEKIKGNEKWLNYLFSSNDEGKVMKLWKESRCQA